MQKLRVHTQRALRRVRHRRCIPEGVRFSDPSLSLLIEIKEMPFDSLHHRWNPPVYDSISKAYDWDGLIDGEEAYGTDAFELDRKDSERRLPDEIRSIKIRWNGIDLSVPKRAYKNLFDPWLCNPNADQVEAYVTQDKKRLYIWLAGSDGDGSYAVKFTFDHKGYVGRNISAGEE